MEKYNAVFFMWDEFESFLNEIYEKPGRLEEDGEVSNWKMIFWNNDIKEEYEYSDIELYPDLEKKLGFSIETQFIDHNGIWFTYKGDNV